jgi:bis(5'-nucleosyl)-tetraphosphatase (symmetrical)
LARYAIGDVQGCLAPLQELLRALHFNADRDQLFFTGDLVNRGPHSLQVLRLVKTMQDNASVVLGNHDLHLLALHFDPDRKARASDTLAETLAARDCPALMEWLLERPLLMADTALGDVIVHAGLIPQWDIAEARQIADAAAGALRGNPRAFLAQMYGNQPDRWSDAHSATDRHRFAINALTRMRYCTADGTINLKLKDAPHEVRAPWRPWYELHSRRAAGTRVIFGHWSTLGFLQRPAVLALDTGCVWGGALTAINLDAANPRPIQVPCAACQQPGGD